MTAEKAHTNILNLSREQLAEWLSERGIAAYRAGQILKWIYRRQKDSFADMSDIAKDVRALLPRHFRIPRLELMALQSSADGTRKYLFGLEDGESIESVLIPERDHYTLCVSSQAGCAQNCQFCLTAKSKLRRNLAPGEILGQVRDIKNDLPTPEQLTNLVFMGMGEPLANFDNLISALAIITDSDVGLGFAAKRVTVSTAGLVPKMLDLGRQSRVSLAVSLNAADNETRSRLMPINRKYPLETLLEACRNYPLPPGRRITFEYILIKGVNDGLEDARRLARLLQPIRCKVNLIPFNPHEGSGFERPSEDTILAFQEVLLRKHYTVIIRQSKGQDISAACGQLRSRLAEASRE
ncbi:MAG: 23S rRNA (adenine(2503)-C(2))-methyltransferase RlmN [Hyphomicrobiales bacterium]